MRARGKNYYHHSTMLYRKKISLVCCRWHSRTRNNTDGNKLVIFSGIALCYGDINIAKTGGYCKLSVREGLGMKLVLGTNCNALVDIQGGQEKL